MRSELSAAQLKKALNIRTKIDKLNTRIDRLQKQLQEVLGGAAVKSKVAVHRKIKAQRKIGFIKSKRGNLKKLVVKVLEKAGKPLRIAEIYKELKKAGYKTTSKNPIRQLSTRLYGDKNLKRPFPGTFALQ
ncbi:MAG: winged helix-turn-helix domain-containing protein [Kiritimatiellae bacterium]|jgi:hypothetical protein|nr:winged helix-turn-helix domain-containing protein [Kiritimatiellia bacterium]